MTLGKFHDFCVLCALEQHVKQALERVPDNLADNSIAPTKFVGKIRGKLFDPAYGRPTGILS